MDPTDGDCNEDSYAALQKRYKRLSRLAQDQEDEICRLEDDLALANTRDEEAQGTIARLQSETRTIRRTNSDLEYEVREMACQREEMIREREEMTLEARRLSLQLQTAPAILPSHCLMATQATTDIYYCPVPQVEPKENAALRSEAENEDIKVHLATEDRHNEELRNPAFAKEKNDLPPLSPIDIPAIEACEQVQALFRTTHSEVTAMLLRRIKRAKTRALWIASSEP